MTTTPLVVPMAIETTAILNANNRLHHQQHARIAKDLLNRGRQFALAATRAQDWEMPAKALCLVFVSYPKVARRRDAANLHPTVKPLLDGMVKAHVVADDEDKNLRGPFILPAATVSSRPGCYELRFEFYPLEAFLLDQEVRLLAQTCQDVQ